MNEDLRTSSSSAYIRAGRLGGKRRTRKHLKHNPVFWSIPFRHTTTKLLVARCEHKLHRKHRLSCPGVKRTVTREEFEVDPGLMQRLLKEMARVFAVPVTKLTGGYAVR